MAEAQTEDGPQDESNVQSEVDGEVPSKCVDKENGSYEKTTGGPEEHADRLDEVLVCDPCKDEERTVTAEGFCVNCNDYLCFDCFQHHRKPKPMRHHVLQDKNDMPNAKPITNTENSNEIKCQVHLDKTLVYYCSFHDTVTCETCNMMDHRQCQKRGLVAEVDESLLDKEQVDDIECQLGKMQKECRKNEEIADQNSTNITNSFKQVIHALTRIKNADLKVKESIKMACIKMEQEITPVTENLCRLAAHPQNTQLFIAFKLAQSQIKSVEKELIQVKHDNKMFEYRLFDTRTDSTDCYGPSGTLQRVPKEHEAIYVGIDSKENLQSCITGIATLTKDKLVVTDSENQNIKLFDLTEKTVTLDLQLDENPMDIAVVNDNTVVVTTGKRILFLSVSDEITIQRTILKPYLIKGIIFNKESLIVSGTWPNENNSIHILDEQGTSKKELKGGSSKFGKCDYIDQNPSTKTLFISDYNHDRIVSMTTDGEVITKFTHVSLKEPRGITVGKDGRIFVCSYGSNNIFELLGDLSAGEIILDEHAGIDEPISILYNDEENKLYVGSFDDIVQVFSV